MRKHSFIQIIAVIIAFIIGIVANVAARTLVLPRILPTGLQPMTGLLAVLIQIVVSGVIVILIGIFSRRDR